MASGFQDTTRICTSMTVTGTIGRGVLCTYFSCNVTSSFACKLWRTEHSVLSYLLRKASWKKVAAEQRSFAHSREVHSRRSRGILNTCFVLCCNENKTPPSIVRQKRENMARPHGGAECRSTMRELLFSQLDRKFVRRLKVSG